MKIKLNGGKSEEDKTKSEDPSYQLKGQEVKKPEKLYSTTVFYNGLTYEQYVMKLRAMFTNIISCGFDEENELKQRNPIDSDCKSELLSIPKNQN